MANVDRWPVEMQMLQEAIVWLVQDEASARTLVAEAGIPETFIDFGEPVWNRIKRIMVEAEKREMMPALLAVITSWYSENLALREAKAAWEEGRDRKAAAIALRKAAKAIPDPIAVAKITRRGDVITDVDVDVTIPEAEENVEVKILDVEESTALSELKKAKPMQNPPPELSDVPPVDVQYSDEMAPGDWFSTQRTLSDQEQRLKELETWRRQLSIMPTVAKEEHQ